MYELLWNDFQDIFNMEKKEASMQRVPTVCYISCYQEGDIRR